MCDGTYAVSAEQSTIVVVGSNNIYPEGIRTELLASIGTPSEQSYLMVDVVGMLLPPPPLLGPELSLLPLPALLPLLPLPPASYSRPVDLLSCLRFAA